MLAWPDVEAAVMMREYPAPRSADWYEARKWPKGWSALGDLKGQKVLDVGCHTGWIGWLAQECGAEVWASDIFGTAVHPSLYFIHAMTEDLPFADGMFDQVLTANTLHHVQGLDLALREIARVLKPGGKFTTFQEPCIPSWITEDEEQRRCPDCVRERAKGVTERRYHGWEYREALDRHFSETKVWACHGNPLVPDEHNWSPLEWDALDGYHGGCGFQATK